MEKICNFINILVMTPDFFKIENLNFRSENKSVINDV